MRSDYVAENDVGLLRAGAAHGGLRRTLIRSGTALLGRQFASMALSLLGLLMITRLVGPVAYGPYVAALGIYQYAQNLGQAGIGVYLVRAPDVVHERAWHVATTVLAGSALLLLAVLEAGAGTIGRWISMPETQPILSVLMLALVPQTLAVAAGARLERALDFRKIAMIEIGGQALYYMLALPLVLAGYGVWSLVAGWLAQQIFICIGFHIAARYRPRFALDWGIAAGMLRYAAGIAVCDWSWQVRGLVNPLIAGHFLSAEAVGQIGLAIRLMDLLSFSKAVAWRLSVAGLARIQGQPRKLLAAATEGMRLQVLALGPVLIGFSWFGGFVLTLMFGPRWDPVMTVFPYLALAGLTNAQFGLHSAILYVLRCNREVGVFHVVHIGLFAVASWFAIGRWGLVGYGIGEIAALLSYPILHWSVRRLIGAPIFGISAVWWVCLAIGLFWRELGLWAVAAPIAGLLCPASLRVLKQYYVMIAGAPRHAV